jgi:hypothetical protein
MTLAEYITRHLLVPFSWGSNDCVLFASGWANYRAGRNLLEGLPKWTTQRGAYRAIKFAGGLEKAMDERLKRINPNLAQDGDLALYKNAVCIFSGAYIVGPGPNGLNYIDRMEAEAAWSI